MADSDLHLSNGQGSANCRKQREALMAYIARKKAGHAAKTQQQSQRPPAGTVDDQAQEGWPAGGQQGWPEKGWEQSFDGSGSRETDSEDKAKW